MTAALAACLALTGPVGRVEAADERSTWEPPPDAVEPSAWYESPGLLLTSSGVLVLGAGLAWFFVADSRYESALDRVTCTSGPPTCPTYEERIVLAEEAAAMRPQRVYAGAVAGVGGALLVSGVITLILTADSGDDAAAWSNLRIVPDVATGAGHVQWHVRF